MKSKVITYIALAVMCSPLYMPYVARYIQKPRLYTVWLGLKMIADVYILFAFPYGLGIVCVILAGGMYYPTMIEEAARSWREGRAG